MVGIGLRREFAEEMLTTMILKPDFVELAPENWMEMGGYWKKLLNRVVEQYPVFCHGLSLSIGSVDEVNWNFVRKIKKFLNEHRIKLYSEHMSFSSCHNAHLYELMPIPFRFDAVRHISEKIRQVQDFLEMPLVLEIVSYYTTVAAEMTESEFINSIIRESGCLLLLDINNIYVNGYNHHYNPDAFIDTLPLDKVSYLHMAGHEMVANDLIIDTHGSPIIDPVYELYERTLNKIKKVPVLLERDFNIPEIIELQKEITHLRTIHDKKHNQYERSEYSIG